MENNLNQRRSGLEEKIPDIKKTLAMVEYLQERRVRSCIFLLVIILNDVQEAKTGGSSSPDDDDLEDDDDSLSKPMKTTFELNDTLYAEAELEDTDSVYLWLGVRPFYLIFTISF